MRKLFFIVMILLGLNSFSQEFKAQLYNDAFLFTYKDNSYVISGDSIFNNRSKKEWVGVRHNLVIKDFVFFQNQNNGYLMHNSGGVIYRFDGTNFIRLDDSFEFNTQYQSFPFVHKDSICNFGGYGLFNYKNIITYFNEPKKETELVYTKTPIIQSPDGRKKMLAQLVGDKLFIGAGLGYNSKKENPFNESDFFADYWVFDFITYKWEKLGAGNILGKDQDYAVVYNFNGKNLFLMYDKVYGVDIQTNTIDYYENANGDLLKSKKKDPVRSYITYNKHEKGFYIILNKANLVNKLVFVSANQFLGKPTRSERLYSLSNNTYLYVLFLVLILFIGVIALILPRKNIFELIGIKRKEIESVLNKEESQIFSKIYDKYPDYVQFPDLMGGFESHLNYESIKKRLRNALYQIEEKAGGVLKTKNKIFIERKCKEDLRIKEIKIK